VKTIKFTYFNDEDEPLRICLHDLMSEQYTVQPYTGIDLSIDIPNDTELFLKRWNYRTMLITHSHKDNFGKHGPQESI